jgi:hypothetical protein
LRRQKGVGELKLFFDGFENRDIRLGGLCHDVSRLADQVPLGFNSAFAL